MYTQIGSIDLKLILSAWFMNFCTASLKSSQFDEQTHSGCLFNFRYLDDFFKIMSVINLINYT